MDSVIFSLDRATVRFDGAAQPVVNEVSFQVRPGELVAVVGPNGSGKTTLTRLMLGVLTPASGTVETLGQPAHAWDRKALARRIGVVVQREEPAFPLRVRDAVFLGRYPHLTALGAPTKADWDAVRQAMAAADVSGLEDRWIASLSGGEWQRVRVARALAQSPDVLILDEPTANLDLGHEMEVFELVAGLVKARGLTAVFVTHHLNLAARFAERMVVMDKGVARAIGKPVDVMKPDVLQAVFGRSVELIPWRGTPQFVPLKQGE